MCAATVDQAIGAVLEAAREVLWTQWSALGALASARGKATAQLDAEALVLLSLSMLEEERRFWDLLWWWGAAGSRLLSVQRMKNLCSRYPKRTKERLSEFARIALREGGDIRWRGLSSSEKFEAARKGKVLDRAPDLREAAALPLRLRLGFGVGVKADVLGFLLGRGTRRASVRMLAAATGYSARAVKRSADELAASRLVKSTEGAPREYGVSTLRAWKDVLGVRGEMPAQRFWAPVYALLAALGERHREENEKKRSRYVLSTQMRDLMEEHREAFDWNGIDVPPPRDFRGAEYVEGFEETLERLRQWLQRSV